MLLTFQDFFAGVFWGISKTELFDDLPQQITSNIDQRVCHSDPAECGCSKLVWNSDPRIMCMKWRATWRSLTFQPRARIFVGLGAPTCNPRCVQQPLSRSKSDQIFSATRKCDLKSYLTPVSMQCCLNRINCAQSQMIRLACLFATGNIGLISFSQGLSNPIGTGPQHTSPMFLSAWYCDRK
jgi:hypothetical protein